MCGLPIADDVEYLSSVLTEEPEPAVLEMDQLEAGLEPKLCKNFPGPALKLLDMKYADVGLGEKRIRQDTREEEKGEQPEELVGQVNWNSVINIHHCSTVCFTLPNYLIALEALALIWALGG
ncbi:hypothetical protein POTOM_060294 [Populus tomentosa]|uniref:Uncharacterized protein n=1 Tax=Populus tomentosa TaxID=118781 RepID=A0A8X8BVY4_POPTO|nr:hypothetical protein POTOM_060294 [Populus tomentosa]